MNIMSVKNGKYILFLVFLLMTFSAVAYAQAPHSVSGTLTYSNGGSPGGGTFTAYIIGRSSENSTRAQPDVGTQAVAL